MSGTKNSGSISTKQQWVAELAKRKRGQPLTPLAHLIDLAWLRAAHRRTRPKAATGVDGVNAIAYEENLGGNLENLLDRAKSGNYRAPPVRRVYIPKGKHDTRPIGIPTHEDKVLQRAVSMLLEPIYEEEFYDFSYGFRPRRSAHGALNALWEGLMRMGGGWILEADISKFFDTVDHKICRDLLRKRVHDGVVTRLVGKWLRAGVLEGGVVRYMSKGTPQGGVISPLLANIYLHHVLDEWWVTEVLPRLGGPAFLVRYADDFLIVCKLKADACRVQAVLPKRFRRFGLRLHPEKTRLLWSRRPPRSTHRPAWKPATFDFLGFTHYWGRARSGSWVLRKKTMKSRQSRALVEIGDWCRRGRHLPLVVQARVLSRKIRGHYAYFGVTGNARCLAIFLYQVRRRWWKWLCRRSQRSYLRWDRFVLLEARHPLPKPRIVHSIYRQRARP